MDYVSGLEHEYVLGDMQVFHEFDVSQFLTNAKTVIQNATVPFDMSLKFNYHTSMLEKAIQNLETIKLDKASIRAFLSKYESYEKVENAHITTRDLDYKKAIIEFRPQYLSQYVTMVQDVLNKVINNTTDTSDIAAFLTGELPLKVKKQVVKTILPYDVRPKDILKSEEVVNMVPVDTMFIKEKLLPFVMKYDHIKEEVLGEANAVYNSIRESEQTIKAMLLAINTLKKENKLDKLMDAKVNQATYNAVRGMMDVISYVTYMMIREINTVTSTILSCNTLYMKIMNVYAVEYVGNVNGGLNVAVNADADVPVDYIVNTDTHSLVDDMVQGDSKAFEIKANRLYEYHASIFDLSLINNPDTGDISDESTYDKTKYSDVSDMFREISDGLNDFSMQGEDYIIVVDDVIEKGGFGVVLSERFRTTLDTIDDVTDYDNKVNAVGSGLVNYVVYKTCMDELKDFGENMQLIANQCKEAFDKLLLLKRRYDLNINGEFKDLEAVNQIKIFFETLREQFIEVVKIVTEKFMSRLNKIGENLVAMDNNLAEQREQLDDVIDTGESVFEDLSDIYEDVESLYAEELKNLQIAYETAKAKIRYNQDVVFVEAPVPGQGAVQGAVVQQVQQPQGQQPQGQLGANQQQNKSATSKVTIQDNNPDAKKQSTAMPKKLGEKFIARLTKYEEVGKRQAAKNVDWLNNNEEGLLSRSYTNVTINIPPYDNVPLKDIPENCNKVASNIKTLNPQALQTINSRGDLYRRIFPFITGITDGAPLKNQFMKEISGCDDNLSPVAISNNELKQKIAGEYIPSAKLYYAQVMDSVVKTLTSVAQSYDALLDAFGKVVETQVGVVPTTPTNATANAKPAAPQQVNASADVYPTDISIFTEANQPNANTAASAGQKLTWLKDAIEQFASSVISVLQNRINSYFKVLSSLAPTPPVKPVKPESQEPQNQAQTQAQAQTQQAQAQA